MKVVVTPERRGDPEHAFGADNADLRLRAVGHVGHEREHPGLRELNGLDRLPGAHDDLPHRHVDAAQFRLQLRQSLGRQQREQVIPRSSRLQNWA